MFSCFNEIYHILHCIAEITDINYKSPSSYLLSVIFSDLAFFTMITGKKSTIKG